MISKEHLEKFKILYKDKYDLTLSDEEATEMSTELVNLMKVLLKPDPIPELENNNNQFEEGEPNETSRILSK